MNIILFGPPGSGKGTQSKVIESALGLKQVSTGDIVRTEIMSGSEVGLKIKSIVDSGGYASDEIIFDLFRKALGTSKSGFIFDGFPRTLNQVKLLEDYLAERGEEISIVVLLEVNESTLVKRLSGRFSCKTCGAVYNDFTKNTKVENVCDICGNSDFVRRADDTEEAVKTRFGIYKSQTEPLIAYFSDANKVMRVDGEKNPEEISRDILGCLRTFKSDQDVVKSV
ncbi:MAG: adenylate kinase [Caedimonadaceae bacterium]|nr:MAG: adenylate kinase [Caedimonadaceae bacterium]